MTDHGNEVVIELHLTLFSEFLCGLFRPSKIAKSAVFQAVFRGIGKSFQSAIEVIIQNKLKYMIKSAKHVGLAPHKIVFRNKFVIITKKESKINIHKVKLKSWSE